MEKMRFVDFVKDPELYFEMVCKMDKPLIISGSKGKDIVVMSKSEYDGMQETFHLMSNPNNAKRLLDAIKADKAGEGETRDLID